jgi:hypothetical protein
MGLSWQQGPLGPNPSGTFLVPDPLPWSCPEALPESRRLAGYVSFDLDQVDLHLDGQLLTTAAHQQVIPYGTDRDLTARSD